MHKSRDWCQGLACLHKAYKEISLVSNDTLWSRLKCIINGYNVIIMWHATAFFHFLSPAHVLQAYRWRDRQALICQQYDGWCPSPPLQVTFITGQFLGKCMTIQCFLKSIKMTLKVKNSFLWAFCNGIIACRKCFQKCRFAISKGALAKIRVQWSQILESFQYYTIHFTYLFEYIRWLIDIF